MKFGVYVKGERLRKKMGLRLFAVSIGEDAGNWCKIEQGKLQAPGNITVLNKICTVLELTGKKRDQFLDLAAECSTSKVPADIKHQIEENEIVPILFRTIDKKRLSKKQLKDLVKRIQDEY